MACLPSASKCEWKELQYFISHYNAINSTRFELEECLDIQHASAQPEVMCKDANSGQLMVVERKSIIWPANHVEKHKAEHIFWNAIIDNLKPATDGAPFTLHVEMPPTVNHVALRNIAKDLAVSIKGGIHSLVDGSGFHFTRPIKGSIFKEFPNDRDCDEPAVGLKIESNESIVEELKVAARTPPEFSEKIVGYFHSCERKFTDYASTKRILLFNYVSGQLFSDCDQNWWKEFLCIHKPTEVIDEIWSSHNYYEDDWGFEKLHHNGTAHCENQ